MDSTTTFCHLAVSSGRRRRSLVTDEWKQAIRSIIAARTISRHLDIQEWLSNHAETDYSGSQAPPPPPAGNAQNTALQAAHASPFNNLHTGYKKDASSEPMKSISRAAPWLESAASSPKRKRWRARISWSHSLRQPMHGSRRSIRPGNRSPDTDGPSETIDCARFRTGRFVGRHSRATARPRRRNPCQRAAASQEPPRGVRAGAGYRPARGVWRDPLFGVDTLFDERIVQWSDRTASCRRPASHTLNALHWISRSRLACVPARGFMPCMPFGSTNSKQRHQKGMLAARRKRQIGGHGDTTRLSQTADRCPPVPPSDTAGPAPSPDDRRGIEDTPIGWPMRPPRRSASQAGRNWCGRRPADCWRDRGLCPGWSKTSRAIRAAGRWIGTRQRPMEPWRRYKFADWRYACLRDRPGRRRPGHRFERRVEGSPSPTGVPMHPSMRTGGGDLRAWQLASSSRSAAARSDHPEPWIEYARFPSDVVIPTTTPWRRPRRKRKNLLHLADLLYRRDQPCAVVSDEF